MARAGRAAQTRPEKSGVQDGLSGAVPIVQLTRSDEGFTSFNPSLLRAVLPGLRGAQSGLLATLQDQGNLNGRARPVATSFSKAF